MQCFLLTVFLQYGPTRKMKHTNNQSPTLRKKDAKSLIMKINKNQRKKPWTHFHNRFSLRQLASRFLDSQAEKLLLQEEVVSLSEKEESSSESEGKESQSKEEESQFEG